VQRIPQERPKTTCKVVFLIMSSRSEDLSKAVIHEGIRTGFWDKAKYWLGIATPDIVTSEEPVLNLETAMQRMQPHDLVDSDTRAWLAAAGNFIWGKPTPQLSASDRARITEKLKRKKTLSPAEKIWLATEEIDTDMF
jgi:hypothetical protein